MLTTLEERVAIDGRIIFMLRVTIACNIGSLIAAVVSIVVR